MTESLVQVDIDGEPLEFDFDNIQKAKLVMTDELLKQALAKD